MRTLQIDDQLSQERKVADLLAPGEVEPLERGKVSQGSKVGDLLAPGEVEPQRGKVSQRSKVARP